MQAALLVQVWSLTTFIGKESRLFNYIVKGSRGRSTFGRRGRSTLRGRDQHTFPGGYHVAVTSQIFNGGIHKIFNANVSTDNDICSSI